MNDWNDVDVGLPPKGVLVDVMCTDGDILLEGCPSEEVKWYSESPVWFKWRVHVPKDCDEDERGVVKFLEGELRYSGFNFGEDWNKELSKFIVDKLTDGGFL